MSVHRDHSFRLSDHWFSIAGSVPHTYTYSKTAVTANVRKEIPWSGVGRLVDFPEPNPRGRMVLRWHVRKERRSPNDLPSSEPHEEANTKKHPAIWWKTASTELHALPFLNKAL